MLPHSHNQSRAKGRSCPLSRRQFYGPYNNTSCAEEIYDTALDTVFVQDAAGRGKSRNSKTILISQAFRLGVCSQTHMRSLIVPLRVKPRRRVGIPFPRCSWCSYAMICTRSTTRSKRNPYSCTLQKMSPYR